MQRKKSASSRCLASRCAKLVQPPAVFCYHHWYQLPEVLREAIARAISRGQHDIAVTLVVEANRYLDNQKTPRRP